MPVKHNKARKRNAAASSEAAVEKRLREVEEVAESLRQNLEEEGITAADVLAALEKTKAHTFDRFYPGLAKKLGRR
jgi:predicted flap endonuclease-1-like 5' DNA nuclease